MRHTIQWMAPSPLWAEAAGAPEGGAVRKALRQPALLRFSTDTFMEDFAATLEHQPARLADFLALPETWREPSDEPDPLERAPEFLRKLGRAREAVNRTLEAANRTSTQTAARGAAQVLGRASASSKLTASKLAVAKAAAAARPLKLYQPAHQRFYLVTAALVCRVAGLPDHALDTGRDERVGYVVRRLIQPEPPKNGPAPPAEEYAFVVSASGQGWQKVTGAGEALVEDEELLRLFPFNFGDTDGRRRRLFGAMIPVGRREAYMGAGPYTPPARDGAPAQGTTRKTARKIHFRMQVAEPWKNLLRTAQDVTDILNDKDKKPTPTESETLIKESREQSQMISWYLLLDLAKYLKQYLPDVWSAVVAGKKDGLKNAPASEILYDELSSLSVKPDLKTKLTQGTKYDKDTHIPATLRDALQLVGNPSKEYEKKLEDNTDPYNRNAAVGANGWPDFIFPLADPELPDLVPLPSATIAEAKPGDESKEEVSLSTEGVKQVLVDRQKLIDNLVALVVRALPADSQEKTPRPPLASQPVLDTREGNFVIRCVYERPFCGPLDPPLVSDPSAVFQLAGFFDSDAPARPIRIALPIDTTPAGLRKFDKNTAFMISDVLCGQMQRLKGITFGDLVLSVLPWPFHKDLSVKAPQIGPCKSGSDSLGMICTFSLPIITICAMILLMIIVLLFDFIFRWIPFFIMCFPLPKFKGKR